MSLESCIDAFNDLCEEDQWRIADILARFLALSEEKQDEVLEEVRKYDVAE